MKEFVRLSGFAFLILILLVGTGAGLAKAQSIAEITPKQIVISGIADVSPFQQPFTVRAVNDNITDLTFTSGNLMEVTKGRYWITGANVQITPEVKSIKKGHSQDFVITVQNIPESGQYDGTITVSYKDQPVDALDTISISVRSVKFSAVPHQIVLQFEKSILGHGGTSDAAWALVLNEDSRQAPQEMITTLAETTAVSIDPLVNGDDISQVIFPEQILVQYPDIENRSAGQGLTIKLNFTNPQADAGKYTGTLTVRSTDHGLITSVPVEAQVRYSSWLAWILIVAGIIISMLISWWNTTGKKKNAIEIDAWKLREKLKTSDITGKCEDEINEMLNDVRELLDENDWEKAQKKVEVAENKLKTCKINKINLCKKATEVKGLVSELEKVEEKVKEIVCANNADEPKVLKEYLPSIKGALEKLKRDIDQEIYQSVDETLNQEVDKKKEKINKFKARAPAGLLDSLAELEDDLERLQDPVYREMFEKEFIKHIKKQLCDIDRDKDLDDVSEAIKKASGDLKKFETLVGEIELFEQKIKDKEKNFDMTKAEEAMTDCKSYLKDGKIPWAEGQMIKLKKAVEEAVVKKSKEINARFSGLNIYKSLKEGDLPKDAEIELRDLLDLEENLLKTAPHEAETTSTTEAPAVPPGCLFSLGMDYNQYLNDGPVSDALKKALCTQDMFLSCKAKITKKDDNHWEIVDGKNRYKLEDTGTQLNIYQPVKSNLLLQKLKLLLQFTWFTPERKELAITILLFIVAIPILAIIGFDQLYANNPIFGAKNVLMEHLALFLWGFGIQTGTATVADVLKTFTGRKQV